jgi:dephospho-CoA kinase
LLKIGITGGIGSGKSVVCQIFNTLGISVFDADAEAKKLYDQPDVKDIIVREFENDLYPEGQFDRKKMADIVFHSPEKLKQLNHLLHPLVERQFQRWVLRQQSHYVVKEAALLIESSSYKTLDYLVLVSCPLNTRIERVMNRDQTSREEVMARIAKQLPEDEKRSYCDFEIINDDRTLLIPQVLALHEKFMNQQK